MKLETLQKDMIAAMKARDKERKDAISSLVICGKEGGHRRRLQGRRAGVTGGSGHTQGAEERKGADRYLP